MSAGRRGVASVSRRVRAIALVSVVIAMLVPSGAVAGTNVIQNGAFSQGLTNWPITVVSGGGFSGYPKVTIQTSDFCDPAQTGNPYISFDVPGAADGYVQQQITVPQSPGPLTFLTWGNLTPVQATVSVVTSGNVVHQVAAFTPPTIQSGGGSTCSGQSPVTKSIDLSQFAGQSVGLRFEATSIGANGDIAGFDNISLSSTGPSLPPVTGHVFDIHGSGLTGYPVAALALNTRGSASTASAAGGPYNLNLPTGDWYVFTTWAVFAPGNPDPFPPIMCPPQPTLTQGEQNQLTADNIQVNLGCVVRIAPGGAPITIDFQEKNRQASIGGPTPQTWLDLYHAPWLGFFGLLPSDTTSLQGTATATPDDSETTGCSLSTSSTSGALGSAANASGQRHARIVVTISRRHAHGGRVHLVFRFGRAALLRAFGHDRAIRVTVVLKIRLRGGRRRTTTIVFVFPRRAVNKNHVALAVLPVATVRTETSAPSAHQADASQITATYQTSQIQSSCLGSLTVQVQDNISGDPNVPANHHVTARFGWSGTYAMCLPGTGRQTFSIGGQMIASFQRGFFNLSANGTNGVDSVNMTGSGGSNQATLYGKVGNGDCVTQLPSQGLNIPNIGP